MDRQCLRATQLVSMAQDAKLPIREQMELRLHLLVCQNCRNFQRNTEALRLIMQHYAKARLLSETEAGDEADPAPKLDTGESGRAKDPGTDSG